MMKKITLTLAIIFCCGLTTTGFAQVMEDDSESDQWVSFYDDVHRGKYKPFEFLPVRRADVVKETRVWRVIDFREKQNQIFYYPLEPTQGRVSLYYALDRAAREGIIRVYSDDDCKKEVEWNERKSKIIPPKTQTLLKWNEDIGEEEPYDTVMTTTIQPEDIKKLRIKENWFVDKQRSVRDVRIFSFALIYDQPEGRGEIALFWVHYDDPEVRQLLANTEVFNPHNDALRLSYDDLFIKRRFASYIMQESNVFARRIGEYLTGEDMLLESNRIENELFNYDEDMWEY
ncbi:MAG: gliding motility protein GldN [Bacteroidales bacterium]|jgi:gliding motility associated protien GldN|nr:gliding motility protein GldN [Bacteroidales bacterium]